MKPTITLFTHFFLYGLTTGDDYRIHIYVSTPMNWNDAYIYCNNYYTDLSTINSEEENQRLVDTGGNFIEAWIGVYKYKNPNHWKWADGHLLNFSKLYIYNSNTFECAYATQVRWFTGYCPVLRPFFCYAIYKLSLVAQNVTWEDALIYCRSRFTDLVSATEKFQVNLLQETVINSPTDSVWTGLRFLAGNWHWVSKSFSYIPYQGFLPSCPIEPYRCGAYSKITAQWEMRDCNEMLSFICY